MTLFLLDASAKYLVVAHSVDVEGVMRPITQVCRESCCPRAKNVAQHVLSCRALLGTVRCTMLLSLCPMLTPMTGLTKRST